MKSPDRELRRIERLRQHYEFEKALAQRLRKASRIERTSLYTRLYDELFREILDHPQLAKKQDPNSTQERVEAQVKKLARFCQRSSTYLEVGAGDCALTIAMAERTRMAYAVEISTEIIKDLETPENLEIVMSDGTSILVARDSVDLVFSNQLIEHLHPDDVPLHLANVIKSLVKGGRYYCITPSRLTGPHDISMYFDDVATGLHLKEYTYSDLSALMRSAGFTKVSAVVNFKNHIIMQPPLSLMKLLERAYVLLPLALRRSLRPSRAVAVIFGVEIIATK